jgi:histidyl-tRNA synthetase
MRGFKTYLPPFSYAVERVRKEFEVLSASFGYDFIYLPVVENAELYFRTSGSESDVCNKELFEVRKYKGEFDNAVLRPEGTASCANAIKEAHYMHDNKFARFAYFAPMFRYNRPQKGRYRQFLQAGWECFGSRDILIDIEMLIAGGKLLERCGVKYVLEINSIGNTEDRQKYREILKKHFNDFEKDPLKILDKLSNIKNDIPHIQLNETDYIRFENTKSLLQSNNIEFIHNPYLVRGLDYYNSIVFEFKSDDGQTLIAGGRYDGLMHQIGGSDVAAIGFAAGVERIAERMQYHHKHKKLVVICLDVQDYAIKKIEELRSTHDCLLLCGLSLKKALEYVKKIGFTNYIIIGSKEEKSTTREK